MVYMTIGKALVHEGSWVAIDEEGQGSIVLRINKVVSKNLAEIGIANIHLTLHLVTTTTGYVCNGGYAVIPRATIKVVKPVK